jgi:hypothetical protein
MSGKKKSQLKLVKGKTISIKAKTESKETTKEAQVSAREILFNRVNEVIEECAEHARQIMSVGQWQDTLGEIQMECAKRARDSGDYGKVV